MSRISTTPNHQSLWLVPGLALLLAAGVAGADGRHRGGPPDPARHVEHLTQELDLSEDQALAIQSILEDHVAEIEALRERVRNDEIDREALHEAARAGRDEAHARVRELLDDDQVSAFDTLQAEREERRGRGGKRGGRRSFDSERER